MADALEYAHKQGIHHRDIKPSNLLLDTQGTVWVTDFGLAKADDQQNLTHTGDILGTLRYMPPEAFEGKTDARSDVYSLGLTLYEMLAFRPAFDEKERNRLIRQVTQEEPARLGKLNRHVPAGSRDDRPQGDRPRARRRYHGRRAGRRLAAVPGRRADQGPAGESSGAIVALVPAESRGREPDGGGMVLVFLIGFAGVASKWRDAEWQKDLARAAQTREATEHTGGRRGAPAGGNQPLSFPGSRGPRHPAPAQRRLPPGRLGSPEAGPRPGDPGQGPGPIAA